MSEANAKRAKAAAGGSALQSGTRPTSAKK